MRGGEANTINYTRGGSAVDPGSVVVDGTIAGVDLHGGPANSLGSLCIDGTFEVVKITETTFTVGSSVYWDAAGDPQGGVAETGAATSSTGAVVLGVCVGLGGDDAATVLVELDQYVVPHA